MTDESRQCSLLDELDARQNEVLDQLDELNNRIELLLQDFTSKKAADSPAGSDEAVVLSLPPTAQDESLRPAA